jgi:hypothetical protein
MPAWTLWGTAAVFGAYLAWFVVRQAVKARRR